MYRLPTKSTTHIVSIVFWILGFLSIYSIIYHHGMIMVYTGTILGSILILNGLINLFQAKKIKNNSTLSIVNLGELKNHDSPFHSHEIHGGTLDGIEGNSFYKSRLPGEVFETEKNYHIETENITNYESYSSFQEYMQKFGFYFMVSYIVISYIAIIFSPPGGMGLGPIIVVLFITCIYLLVWIVHLFSIIKNSRVRNQSYIIWFPINLLGITIFFTVISYFILAT